MILVEEIFDGNRDTLMVSMVMKEGRECQKAPIAARPRLDPWIVMAILGFSMDLSASSEADHPRLTFGCREALPSVVQSFLKDTSPLSRCSGLTYQRQEVRTRLLEQEICSGPEVRRGRFDECFLTVAINVGVRQARKTSGMVGLKLNIISRTS